MSPHWFILGKCKCLLSVHICNWLLLLRGPTQTNELLRFLLDKGTQSTVSCWVTVPVTVLILDAIQAFSLGGGAGNLPPGCLEMMSSAGLTHRGQLFQNIANALIILKF